MLRPRSITLVLGVVRYESPRGKTLKRARPTILALRLYVLTLSIYLRCVSPRYIRVTRIRHHLPPEASRMPAATLRSNLRSTSHKICWARITRTSHVTRSSVSTDAGIGLLGEFSWNVDIAKAWCHVTQRVGPWHAR